MTRSAPPLRILLADDHEPVRRGLRSILQARWDVCAEAVDGRDAVERARAERPDVVLLDFKMPHLNGLDAARAILDERPGTRVLLMTMQPSEELEVEAQRAGIEAVLSKSDAETLGQLLTHMEQRTVNLGGNVVNRTRHIAAFFASDAERYRVMAPFVAEGLERGEKALHIVGRNEQQTHLENLTDAGIDVDAARRQRRFELAEWEEMYFAEGGFDQFAMIARIHAALDRGAEAGFRVTRLVAHMEWALEARRGVEDLAEYESRLNYTIPSSSDVVVCCYDLDAFSATVIVDVMRAHPAIVVGGTLYDNPFYAPPDPFIEELRGRQV